jgi:hypothetical protein
MKHLALLFIGMAIGSISPLGIWGLFIFMLIGTIFMGLDLFLEFKAKHDYIHGRKA